MTSTLEHGPKLLILSLQIIDLPDRYQEHHYYAHIHGNKNTDENKKADAINPSDLVLRESDWNE